MAASPQVPGRVPVRIRLARPKDAAAVAAMNRALALETEGKRLDPSTARRGAARAIRSRALCRFFVATQGGRVVGQTMITFEVTDWEDGLLAWLQSVYVVPRSRNQGVFRALLDHVRAYVGRMPEVRALRLYVERGNRSAIARYERLGFEELPFFLFGASLAEESVSGLRAESSSGAGSPFSRVKARSVSPRRPLRSKRRSS